MLVNKVVVELGTEGAVPEGLGFIVPDTWVSYIAGDIRVMRMGVMIDRVLRPYVLRLLDMLCLLALGG